MEPRSVRIGGMTKGALLAELQRKGVQLNEIAQELFAHPDFVTSESQSVLATAVASVGELGHKEGATLDQVFSAAAKRGLFLCPLELAPHLRLQFVDQPEGYWGHPPSEKRAPPGALTVASRQIIARNGMPMGFYLRRIKGVLWLRGYRSAAIHLWSADDHFVFCRGGDTLAL